MSYEWFKVRGYKHFDAPVGLGFASNAYNETFVASHSWSPLIHFIKRTKRYKPNDGRTVFKDRPIMYASHRDACILSKYAAHLTKLLDEEYKQTGLTKNVLAYRRLGKANYHFSASARQFAITNLPCVILCFDITGFFDNLDHSLLKKRLKKLLNVEELSADWYKVFRHVTRFRKISRDVLSQHPLFGCRLKSRAPIPIGTMAEIKNAGIQIEENPLNKGIPQGTPISSALSNLYMLELDKVVAAKCATLGALYQRYSDDILIICSIENEKEIVKALKDEVHNHKLEIKDEKTERALFDSTSQQAFQYLGFNISQDGAVIRPSSLSRQWRKLKRNLIRTKNVGGDAIAIGKAKKIYTKKLRRRFTPVGAQNFSSYARKAAKTFGSRKIVKQMARLERAADKAIRELNEP